MISKMSGCFDDMPCPSANVRTTFYEYVRSLRLHRLPEQQMLSSKTNEFYANTKELASSPEFFLTELPYWQTNLPSNNTSTNRSSYASVIIIEEVKRTVAFNTEKNNNETQINFVNEHSIRHISDKLIMRTNSLANKMTVEQCKLRICNVDLLMHSSHGEFMFSVLLLGIVNILHHSRKTHRKNNSAVSSVTDMESRSGIVIELCVVSNEHGKRVADIIQYYLEIQCHIAVKRSTNLSTTVNVEIDDGSVCTNNDNENEQEEERQEWNMSSVNSYYYWIDELKSNVVDLHEQLYDELSAPGALLGVNKKQVILLILPDVSTLRKDIKNAFADAYTSIPMEVHEEREICKNDTSSLHLEIPLVLMCSIEWLHEQTLLAPERTVFFYIHISAIVFAKYVNHELTTSNNINNSNSVDSSYNDELVREYTNDVESIVLMLCNQKQLSHTSSTIICSEINKATLPTILSHAYNENNSKENVLQWELVQANILLSIFRRFQLRNRRVNKLLYMSMHHHNFITERAWWELLMTLVSMHNAGVILADNSLMQANTKNNDINEVEFTLTPFGRLASTTMKMQHNTLNGANVELSVIDKKYLIWMFMFRQSKEKAMQGIRCRHTFNDWVDKSIEAFYEAANITFTKTESSSAHAFHNLCACFAQVGFTTCISDVNIALLSSSVSERKEMIDAEIFAISSKNEDSNTNSDNYDWKESTHNRVYELIVAPHGFRTRSGSDIGDNNAYLPSNMCRGWEVPSSPPLQQHGTSVSQPQIWSLPTASLYCQLLPYAKSTTSGVQCPVIYSQPIIILHSLLHISFHNACIFAEMESDVLQIPLPELLLQSPVFNMLLQSSSLSSSAYLQENEMESRESWVDVYTSFVKAVPSASEMFSLLSLHNTHFIETCEHGSRKRERESSESELQRILSAQRDAAKSSGSSSNTKTFSGVQPRTPLEEEAITQFLKLVERVGREKAERAFRGKKGFAFIDSKHDLHPFYLYSLKKEQEDN